MFEKLLPINEFSYPKKKKKKTCSPKTTKMAAQKIKFFAAHL
jgi:hypothetical protein